MSWTCKSCGVRNDLNDEQSCFCCHKERSYSKPRVAEQIKELMLATKAITPGDISEDTYADGVVATLLWVLGACDEKPMGDT